MDNTVDTDKEKINSKNQKAKQSEAKQSHISKFFSFCRACFSSYKQTLMEDKICRNYQFRCCGKSLFTIKDFHIIRTIGIGGYGRVLLVYWKNDPNRIPFALKVISKHLIKKSNILEHMKNERNILLRLKHPFMITLQVAFQDWKNLYLVLEYAPGGELFSILKRFGKFSSHIARFYAAEVLLCIKYFHSRAIIYRDLKLENILLDRNGHVLLADYGLSKFIPTEYTNTICGTPEYMAPEIIKGRFYGFPADWYTFGVMIYEMLVGKCPFHIHKGPLNPYKEVLSGRLQFPQSIDPVAVDLILSLCKAEPETRPSVSEIMAHPWFEGIDWRRVLKKQIEPPYVPTFIDEHPSIHYIEYEENESLFQVVKKDLRECGYIERWDHPPHPHVNPPQYLEYKDSSCLPTDTEYLPRSKH